ncbi:unnamed protein product [Schistosoma margrebowiei]|uniref:Receptor L-domain domain-containing protein n=1 Tax=Schistosoma margrebowiei TaxID=48269 RepID=A0A3P8BLX8_9TREM|nr:unnamed protein product [Schistosoma margrebowiei]
MMAYSILNTSGHPLKQLLKLSSNTNLSGNTRKLETQHSKRDCRHNFYSIRLVKYWNSLPAELVQATSQESFKRQLDFEDDTGIQLLRCSVIEGDLFVVFTRIPRDASLPLLREITGSLLVYDVEGPDDLSNLLPNLTLIRGQTLVFGYAVVIKSTSLKNIGLFSLRVIQQGGIRIDNNPQLCYVRTIDWNVILQDQSAGVSSVKIVKNGLMCPNTCSSDCSVASQSTGRLSAVGIWSPSLRDISPTDGHCWSVNKCQSSK